jgi:hypothetical protein
MLLSSGADPSTCHVTTALVKVWQRHSDHETLAQHTLASLQHLAQGTFYFFFIIEICTYTDSVDGLSQTPRTR